MRSFFSKSGSSSAQSREPLDIARVGSVFKHFPFGTVVRYYPEFKKNIVLESVILGYLLDKSWFFAAQEVVIENEGNAARLLVGPQRAALRPTTMSIVIPAQSRGVEQLDYERREELERTGGLAKGNNITLIGQPRNGKTAIIETMVRKKSAVPDGLYAKTPVVLLDVNIGSLQLTDQRAHMRLQTWVPAQVSCSDDAFTTCTMVDFSDLSVRLTIGVPWDDAFKAGCVVTLSLQLPGRNGGVVLRGEVFRRDESDLVVTLDAMRRDGQFQRIEVIDVLELKARLLQLPETSV